MSFWKSLEGVVEAELTGADPGASLASINKQDIPLSRITWEDPLTVRFLCSRRYWKILSGLCEKRGDTLRFIGGTGLFYRGKALLSRPVLMWGIVVFLALTVILPTRVLFFRVEGNKTVPDRQILAAAEECGIRFGVSRRTVRSERMKNALLGVMPELQWAGINTAGCTAVISVREREPQTEKPADSGIGSIAAVRDGYITSCTVTRGTALCSPGQVVKAGQILISGYTDCGIALQVTRASGEVFAESIHDFHAAAPMVQLACIEKEVPRHRYGLLLGKKRINFWKGSGISPATCGRMYAEYYMTLPGGFSLPVGIWVETLWDRNFSLQHRSIEVLEEGLRDYARTRVQEDTVAGTILREDVTFSQDGALCILKGKYLCSEMIGRVITEEIGELHGKTD